MESLFNVVIYIVVGIFFLLVLLKFGKPSKKSDSGIPSFYKGKVPESRFRELAIYLGLEYEDNAPKGDNKVLLNSAERIHGTYNGVYVDINYGGYANEIKNLNPAYSYSYEYSINKTISFNVQNRGKEFSLIPLNKNIVPNPTGNKEFDKSLFFSGNIPLPQEYLEYFTKMRWMNLHLKEGKLLFVDSFYEDISASKGSMAMMTAVHPVYKVSAQNFNNFKFEDFVNFLNKIISLIDQLGMKWILKQ